MPPTPEVYFSVFGVGSGRAGRDLKRCLEAVGFVLAEFEPKLSHGDPVRGRNCGFGTYDMCWNMVPRYHGTMVPCIMVPWYHGRGTMVLWYMDPWYHGTMVPWYHDSYQ